MSRTIDPAIWRDSFFIRLSVLDRLLWIGILNRYVDDQGRFVNEPDIIRLEIFPMDEISTAEIRRSLGKFIKAGKLHAYQAGGKDLLQVVNWWRYQIKSQWMSPSCFPAPKKWVDRIRCHGKGNQMIVENWNHPGGFNGRHPIEKKLQVLQPPLPSQLPSEPPSPLSSREVDVNVDVNVDDDVNDNVESVDSKAQGEKSARSSAQQSADRVTADIGISSLFDLLQIPEKYQPTLRNDRTIRSSDLIAEYARNLKRKNVNKPGSITAMNLVKHEYPADMYYEEKCWRKLPEIIQKKINLEINAGRKYQSSDDLFEEPNKLGLPINS